MSIPVVLTAKDPDDHIRAYLSTKGAPFALLQTSWPDVYNLVPQSIHAFGLFQNAGWTYRCAQQTALAPFFPNFHSGHILSAQH
jgi:hypothetical protein